MSYDNSYFLLFCLYGVFLLYINNSLFKVHLTSSLLLLLSVKFGKNEKQCMLFALFTRRIVKTSFNNKLKSVK